MIVKSAVLVALALGAWAVGAIPVQGAGFELFFSGKRNGQIETCGCAAFDQGGVVNEAAIYRDCGKPNLRVDAGQWMNTSAAAYPVQAMQSRYLLLALEQLKYDAINVGLSDAAFEAEFIDWFARRRPAAAKPLVSANVFRKDRPDLPAFKPYRMIERKMSDGRTARIGVTGVTDPACANQMMIDIKRLNTVTSGGVIAVTPGYAIKDPVASLKPVLAEMKSKTDLTIILHSGELSGARGIAHAFPDVLCVVTTAMTPERAKIEMDGEGAIILRVPNVNGRQIGGAEVQFDGVGSKPRVAGVEALDVKQSAQTDPILKELVEGFAKISGKSIKPTNGPLTVYGGVQRCLVCHRDIYQSWKTTPHARAMGRLVIEDEQFNTERLKRATTGFGRPGGFSHVAQLQSQMLMGVQCEACHGPSLQHAALELKLTRVALAPAEKAVVEAEAKRVMPRRAVPASTCLGCHGSTIDPDFQYDRDLPKIKHSVSAAEHAKGPKIQ